VIKPEFQLPTRGLGNCAAVKANSISSIFIGMDYQRAGEIGISVAF
jgi:hypothetical protein